MAGITAGLFWLGTYVSEYKILKEKLSQVDKLMAKDREVVEEKIKLMAKEWEVVEEKLKADREVVEEKVKAAKAEGAKETADRFLMFGYAAEYEKYQEKVKGGTAANNAGGVGSV